MDELVRGILFQAPAVAAAGDPCSEVTSPPCQLVALSGAVVLWRIAPVINVSVRVCDVLLPVRTHQPSLSQGTWQGPCAVCFEGETQGFCVFCASHVCRRKCVCQPRVSFLRSSPLGCLCYCMCLFVCVCICMCVGTHGTVHTYHVVPGTKLSSADPDGSCFCPPRQLASLPP